MAEKPIGISMIGCGTVGGGVVELLRECASEYAVRVGRAIELRSVLVRDRKKAIDRCGLAPEIVTDNPDKFFDVGHSSIVVEVAGGCGTIGAYVRRALRDGRHVVTANKSLLAAEGPEIFGLARKSGTSVAFEAACGGGMPVVTAMLTGLMANRITGLYGILNGTCNYILTQMTGEGWTYDKALAEAQALGFAEADPTLDVSGRDAAEKLAILASLAFGIRASGDEVWCEGIDGLALEDLRFGAELGYEIKLMAIAERSGGDGEQGAVSLRTHPCFINRSSPLALVRGSYNAMSVYGHAVGHTMYYGRGAGRMPTASAVVSDILNVASGWYPHAFKTMGLWPDRFPSATLVDAGDLGSRFYIRVNAKDEPGVLAGVSAILGESGISISSVLQRDDAAGEFVPVVITTHEATQGAMRRALERVEALDVIADRPVWIRIVDLPQ